MQVKQLIVVGFSSIAYLLGTQARGQFKEIGFELGPSARILFGNEALRNGQQLALGFSCGLRTSYKINNRLSLQSGLYYELKGGQSPLYTIDLSQPDPILQRRGFSSVQNGGIIEFRSRDNFNFISLPILLKLNLGKEKHWYINAGGSIGYLFRMRGVTLITNRETKRYSPPNTFFSIEYAADFGTGYETALNQKWNMHFAIRNHIGLNNLLDSQNIVGEGSLQTFSCFFLAGLSYRLGEK